MRNKLFFAAAILIALVLAGSVYQVERGLRTADIVYFETLPVDPRALMMGDYMMLRYAFEQEAPSQNITLYVGAQQKAAFDGPGKEIKIKYFADRFKIPHQFYFKEGTGKKYDGAKYVKMRVLPGGELLALDLTDENLNVL